MASNPKFKTLSIPAPLHEKVTELIEGTGFHSVSAFVTFVLRQIVSDGRKEEPFDHEMEEKIISRLKSLGYLN
jgi:hypothetical protein